MPSRCSTAACAARHDQMVERVLASAQSITAVSSRQNGSSGRVAAFGSAPVTISVDVQAIEVGDIGVMPVDDLAGDLRALDRRQREAVEMDTAVARGRLQKLGKLPFGRLQRRVRHVVDEADREYFVGRLAAGSDLVGVAARGSDGRGPDNSPMFVEQHGHAGFGGLFRCLQVRVLRTGQRQRLVDIFDDIADVLDADREADGFRQHAGLALLLRRHLAVRGRRRMAGERFRVADIDQSRDQLQRSHRRSCRLRGRP